MLATTLLRDKIVDTLPLARLTAMLTASGQGILGVPKTVDVICMFVSLVRSSSPAAPPLMLVWDGSTEGCLSVSSLPSLVSATFKPAEAAGEVPRANSSYSPEEAILSMNASLNASNIFSSCSDLSQVESMRPRISSFSAKEASSVLPGEAVGIEIHNQELLEVAGQLAPGTWLRLRSLKVPYVPPPLQSSRLCIRARVEQDTHVVVLPPYANDPSQLACELDNKLRRAASVMHRNRVGGAGGNGNGNVAAQQGPRAMGAPRLIAGAQGEELTNLALVLCTPAPCKFCVRACIHSYFPRDVADFTMDAAQFYARRDRGAGGGGQMLPGADKATVLATTSPAENTALEAITSGTGNSGREFLFSIRIADDLGETDAILSGKDAEFFLGGVTADEFHAEVLAERQEQEQEQERQKGIAEQDVPQDEPPLLDSAGNPVVINATAASTEPVRRHRGIVRRLQARLDGLVKIHATWAHQPISRRTSAIFQLYLRAYTDNVGMAVETHSSTSPKGGKGGKALPTAYKRFAVFNTSLRL